MIGIGLGILNIAAFIALNKELAANWPPIIERKPAPADADEWAKKKDKKGLLER